MFRQQFSLIRPHTFMCLKMLHMFSTYFISPAKKAKALTRKCEVTYAYNAVHEDELELAVGETIEILKEVTLFCELKTLLPI